MFSEFLLSDFNFWSLLYPSLLFLIAIILLGNGRRQIVAKAVLCGNSVMVFFGNLVVVVISGWK